MPIIPYSQLQDYLLKCIKKALDEVGEKVNELLREHIDEDVYRAGYQRNYYAYGTAQPTFDLRKSVTTSNVKASDNQAEVFIYHDKNKMRLDPDNFVHGSNYWRNRDIRDILPEIIEYGLSGDLFGKGWWQDPRPYVQNTINELKSQGKLRQWFKEALEKQGLKVK